jgi:acetyl-CoA carboxylase biotin carboxyl carrier protein
MAEKILAPLAGNIVAVNIKVGDAVQEDDEAMVIEAMKMETLVYVPCKGTVKEILVKEGAMVEEDDVLAVIE